MTNGDTPRISILCKEARPGSVKTRLAATIGDIPACAVHLALANHTLSVAIQTKYPVWLWLRGKPGPLARRWHSHPQVTICEQPEGDLGAKIFHTFNQPGHNIVLGTDTVLTREDILQAQGPGLFIGPAEDGGYWLISDNSPEESLFKGIQWSTASVFEQTQQRAQLLNKHCNLLRLRYDVDIARDLQRLVVDPSCPHSLKEVLKHYA